MPHPTDSFRKIIPRLCDRFLRSDSDCSVRSCFSYSDFCYSDSGSADSAGSDSDCYSADSDYCSAFRFPLFIK